jgi:hypothetical protein
MTLPYRYIALDAYPLGNATVTHVRRGSIPTSSQECKQWIDDCEQAGAIMLVPAIAYYEEVRELELRRATGQIARLQHYCFDSKRFVPLSTKDLSQAAKLWAQVRQAGQPTTDRHALDGDAILAAQILNLGLPKNDVVIVTKNPKHFMRFGLATEEWQNIQP